MPKKKSYSNLRVCLQLNDCERKDKITVIVPLLCFNLFLSFKMAYSRMFIYINKSRREGWNTLNWFNHASFSTRFKTRRGGFGISLVKP